MNINCDARSYVARNQSCEEFLKYVGNVIEQQLKEWNVDYEVLIMKFGDYVVVIKNSVQYYRVSLAEEELEHLLKSGIYQLDRKVWQELEQQGLPILQGNGDYLEKVL